MFRYSQSSGDMFLDGSLIGRGYAGRGKGINNPAMQGTACFGPLPRGFYTIEKPEDPPFDRGPISMRLIPRPSNDMMGRSGFFIHGDLVHGPAREASHGCIIMGHPIRQVIEGEVLGGRDQLEVVE